MHDMSFLSNSKYIIHLVHSGWGLIFQMRRRLQIYKCKLAKNLPELYPFVIHEVWESFIQDACCYFCNLLFYLIILIMPYVLDFGLDWLSYHGILTTQKMSYLIFQITSACLYFVSSIYWVVTKRSCSVLVIVPGLHHMYLIGQGDCILYLDLKKTNLSYIFPQIIFIRNFLRDLVHAPESFGGVPIHSIDIQQSITVIS